MNLTKLEQQAQRLWLRLQNARFQAVAAGDFDRARRIEPISERAFWRLTQRLARRYT
jgi:hypothetical protein